MFGVKADVTRSNRPNTINKLVADSCKASLCVSRAGPSTHHRFDTFALTRALIPSFPTTRAFRGTRRLQPHASHGDTIEQLPSEQNVCEEE